MVGIRDPAFTRVLEGIEALEPESGSLYITGRSSEERSGHAEEIEGRCKGVEFARFVSGDRWRVKWDLMGVRREVELRGRKSVAGLLDAGRFARYYLDVTGLAHHVWAPVLRLLMERSEPVVGVYVEPGDYRFSEAPTEGSLFDLSERFEGIAPLPGFASLAPPATREAVFVPLLGFEGARFAHVVEHVQPEGDRIVPVVGVPGYRPEYPFYTYVANRGTLIETRSWENVRYAAANCPFAIYSLLKELFEAFDRRPMVVAAIGTKPHAMGAVLYHLAHADVTELVYDHPVRKAERTAGTSRVCLYELWRLRGNG